jgi:hypothetical protein
MSSYLLQGDGVSKLLLPGGIGGALILDGPIAQQRHFWRIIILDRNLHLVDIPQSDIESWSCKSSLNGGSGTGQIVFVRDFNKIGALSYGYTVMIWFWSEGQTMPTDPYYSGLIIDELDQEQLEARGRITVNLRGDSSLLDAGIVTSTVTGGIGGATPMPDAALYLNTLITTYQPPSFLAPVIPSSMFQLWPLQFDGTKLGACIDTVCKQSLDPSGHSFVWFVKTNRLGQRQVIIQLDQNPNVVAGATFSYQWPGITCDQYKIQNIYRNILNVVAIYGGKDPITGVQVYQVAQDATSIASFGVWEDKLSVPALLSNAAALSYAQTWLAQNSSPTASGTTRMLNPDPSILAGRWVQFNETPATSTTAVVIKQVKIAEVDVQCSGQRIAQTLNTSSPIPYLDEAIYRLGQNVAASGAIQNKPLPVNTQTLFVIAGGAVSLASSSPAKITITACTLVFPIVGQITIAALGATTVADTTTSATGDGDYTVWAKSTGSFSISKGLPPSPSTTMQLIAKISVVAGTPFVTDARTLMAAPAIDTTQPLVLSGSVTIGAPPNAGAGAYDQPISFTLQSPFGTTANTGLAKLQLGWRATGSSVAIAPSGADITPNASGSYSGTLLGLGSGTSIDIYVRGMDSHDLSTTLPSATQGWLYLATVIHQQADVQFVGAVLDLSTGYLTINDANVHPTTQPYSLPPAGVGSLLDVSFNHKSGSTAVSPAIWHFYSATSGDNGYQCFWFASDGKIYFEKWTAGAPSILAISATAVTRDATTFHNLRFITTEMASGAVNLTAILDGQLMLQYTDSSSPYTSGLVAAQFRDAVAANVIDQKTIEITLGGTPSSSILKSQGSVVPSTLPQVTITICSPTYAISPGQRIVEISSSALQITFADLSQIPIASTNFLVNDTSGVDGVWYYSVAIVLATMTGIFYLSQTAPTPAQLVQFVADGVLPLLVGQSLTVPAGGIGTNIAAVGVSRRYI